MNLLKKLGITEAQIEKGFPIYLDTEDDGNIMVIVSAKSLNTLIAICNDALVCVDCEGWGKCTKPDSCPLKMYAPTVEKCTKRDFGEFRS